MLFVWTVIILFAMIGAAHVFAPDSVSGLPGQFNTQRPVEEPTTGHALYLGEDDISYINRIFRDRSHEIAYCGLVSGGGEVTSHLADTITATPEGVSFSTSNCLTNKYHQLALMHTHPNGNSNPSQTDVETLLTNDAAYLCVQSGEITAPPGQQADELTCYTESDGDDIYDVLEVPVVVVD